ncbi:EAL domain-containing protein [Nitrosovibrio tenuis]|uniref:EAL domain, c-di-GMP-specific phosphodiesterase class I (Or its enzymatically inactive variant) n=1 Tax=Nitrosovibrio tenuis TaxID=1233 RepID=A0A1H7N690_9PROT|nr:EAL domain-containing protein [Nitrosovibrio tenuis]SEL18821.1 EAL domain, c-di-GMP-specific phosphodiesterase class I (or its enzymatically inactive variant) [Nitrosovibrio tenuis]
MNVSVNETKDELARIQEATDYPVQRSEDGWIVGHFFNCWLSSVFQPVFDTSGRTVTGHAAYIRSATDGTSVLSPWKVFALTEGDALLVRFDRLCRVIHALNYFANASHGDLFVTVQPRLLESVKDDHGRAFERILNIIGAETSRVVIEIPTEVNRDSRLLKHVISNYRSRGYRIAVNHSGASEDWMAELASLYPLYPDIVRLEASILLRRYGTGSLVDAVHHFGASVLVHEIETTQQMTAAIQARANFLQGRALGMPVRAIESVVPVVDNRTISGAGWKSSVKP